MSLFVNIYITVLVYVSMCITHSVGLYVSIDYSQCQSVFLCALQSVFIYIYFNIYISLSVNLWYL